MIKDAADMQKNKGAGHKKDLGTDHTQNRGTDYTQYRLNPMQRAAGAAALLAVSCIFAVLFYKSLIPAAAGMLLLPLIWRLMERALRDRRKDELIRQFCDGMKGYAAAIRVGYSPESGIAEAVRSLSGIYGEDSLLSREFVLMRRRLSVGETIEQIMKDLGERSGIREISDMAGVFAVAKRSGGSLPSILRESVYILEEKNRIREEIRTLMTAKRLEERIMCLMPAGILLYVNLTGKDFVAPLYEGLTGRLIMTVFLAVYVLMICVGEKMMRIKL